MIIALLMTAAVLALALWLTILYAWWRQESGKPSQTPVTAIASEYVQFCSRLGRRGWYACLLYTRTIGVWINGKMRNAFFALFPNAEPAFAKRDELAGLKHGPTSYFLRSISESEAKSAASKKTVTKFS